MKQKTVLNTNREEQDLLWQKIASFPIDDPNADFPFSRKLAHENNWDYDFSLDAIEEYRKFIFLCCISPYGASPSLVIDEVWHLHLLYTKNYWEDFCEGTLNRHIHHHPSAGGMSEKEKHENWRTFTQELYRNTFEIEPPPAQWNDNLSRPAPKDKWRTRLIKQFPGLLLVLPFLLTGCDKNDVTSQIPFLAIIILISIASGAVQRKSDPDDKKKNDGSCSSTGGCGSSGCGSSGCGGGCGGCGS